MPSLLDLLLPRRCVGCGAPADTLCRACTGLLRPVRPPLCTRCGAPTGWPVERCRECVGQRLGFSSARSGYVYVGAARAFVRVWKERGLRHLAARAAELVCAVVERPGAGLVVAVPPDDERLLRRGHHPPGNLARELARRWELDTAPVLERTRLASRQASLHRDDRRRNVRGLFVAPGVVPARIILVDDVYTTGATAMAASAALRAAGAECVEVVTFARAVR